MMDARALRCQMTMGMFFLDSPRLVRAVISLILITCFLSGTSSKSQYVSELSALSQMLRNNGVLCRRRRRPYHCRSYSGSGPLSRSGARGRPDRKRFRAVAWVAPSHSCCTVACGRTGETRLARAHEASCEKHQQHSTSRVRRSPTFANSATATPLSLAKCSCMTCE